MSYNWRSLGLDLTSLRLFVAIADEGGLTRAAERENIALSAVSRRISDLEARIGVRLFDRHDRGTSLTPAGRELLQDLRHVFDQLDRIAVNLEATRSGTRGLIRIFAHMSALAGALPDLLAAFLREHEEIDLEIDEVTSLEALHAVRTGTADIGLVSGTISADDLEILHWEEDELVAVVPQGHELSSKPALTLGDIARFPFVGMQRDSALLTLYRDQARAQGATLQVRGHATSFESVKRMVMAGLGLAILPIGAVRPDASEGKILFRPLTESWARRPLGLIVRDASRLPSAARLLISHLVQPQVEQDEGLKPQTIEATHS